MGVDILSVVRAQKLASLNRSIAGSENHEKRVAGLAAKTTALLTGGVIGGHTDNLEEYMMRDTYYHILEEYNRKPNFSPHDAFTPRGLALWKRATAALKSSGVDRETFVRAQFTWFHDKFRTAPTPVQLTTNEAVVRAASVKPQQGVRTNNIEAKIPIGDLFKRCEKQMADLMRAQNMSREDVYRKLVLSGLAVFPEKFLNADPVWRKVKG